MWRVVVMNLVSGNVFYIPCKNQENAVEVESIINHDDYSTDIEEVERQDWDDENTI